MAKASKEKGLAQRVSRIEREVREMRATSPPRPEDVVARQAMAGETPDYFREQGVLSMKVEPSGPSEPVVRGTGWQEPPKHEDRSRQFAVFDAMVSAHGWWPE